MRRGGLRTRLVASFVAVALVGVGTLAILVIAILPSRLSQLVIQRQDEAAERAAQALEDTYRPREGWTEKALRGAASIAADAGGVLEVGTGRGEGQDQGSQPPAGGSPGPAGPGGAGGTPSGPGDGAGPAEQPSGPVQDDPGTRHGQERRSLPRELAGRGILGWRRHGPPRRRSR
jgi:hypothetical protein